MDHFTDLVVRVGGVLTAFVEISVIFFSPLGMILSIFLDISHDMGYAKVIVVMEVTFWSS